MIEIQNEERKQQLIQTLWDDKKGKSGSSSHGLYVGLSSPNPDLVSITGSMLEQLSASPREAFFWAQSWGRLAIAVRAGFTDRCLLADSNDDKNKNFIPIATTRLVSPVGLIAPLPQGELGTILLNSKRTTVEAILISYLHMVDELIWDFSRTKSQRDPIDNYQQSLYQVLERGFSTRLASESEILALREADNSISVRLYGSGVNKDVPKVMGAIDFTPIQGFGVNRFIDQLKERSRFQLTAA